MAVKKGSVPAYKLLYLQQVFLLTTIDKRGVPHVIPQLWTIPVSFKPELVAIAVANTRLTHKLLCQTKEFVLNMPPASLARSVWACAPPHGNGDKFKRAGLTPVKAARVKPPRIKECIAAIECKVVKSIPAGDHTIFVGNVVATHRNKGGRVLLNAPGSHEFSV